MMLLQFGAFGFESKLVEGWKLDNPSEMIANIQFTWDGNAITAISADDYRRRLRDGDRQLGTVKVHINPPKLTVYLASEQLKQCEFNGSLARKIIESLHGGHESYDVEEVIALAEQDLHSMRYMRADIECVVIPASFTYREFCERVWGLFAEENNSKVPFPDGVFYFNDEKKLFGLRDGIGIKDFSFSGADPNGARVAC